MRYHYSDIDLKALCSSISLLIDTREQENGHITDYRSKTGIDFKSRKLDFGDYSFMIPANHPAGIVRDVHFDNRIAIERKARLEELSSNLTTGRAQFESELIRAAGAKIYLLVENPLGFTAICRKQYQTQYEPKTFIATLKTYEARYNLDVNFTDKDNSGRWIYSTCYYWAREYLKNWQRHKIANLCFVNLGSRSTKTANFSEYYKKDGNEGENAKETYYTGIQKIHAPGTAAIC